MAVTVVFALLAGFIVTSLQNWEVTPTATTQTFASRLPTPLPTPSPAPSLVPEDDIWSQVQAARLFDQIAHRVETLRELSPRAEIPLSFLDEREMTALLRQLYIRRGPEVPLLPHTTLGLLPNASVSVYAHPVAGVYVPEQEQLYIVIGRQESGADDQALLAHAYVHALQDQHFDLGAMDARATTTDALLAVQALVEGDATFLTSLYRYEEPAAADWGHLEGLIVRAEQPDYGDDLGHSQVWPRLQHFPYHEGRQFVEVLFQGGGWQAVNQAYTNSPRSTEQVLHPERYLEEQDRPTSVVVPGLEAALGEGWTMLIQDTLGEFVIGLYLDVILPEETAWRAADGWGGDTFVVWEREDGEQVVVWRTIWDSTAEAAEFEHALAALVPQRYLPARPLEPAVGLPGLWWEGGSRAVCVSRVARYVLFVDAPDVGTLTNVMEVMP